MVVTPLLYSGKRNISAPKIVVEKTKLSQNSRQCDFYFILYDKFSYHPMGIPITHCLKSSTYENIDTQFIEQYDTCSPIITVHYHCILVGLTDMNFAISSGDML